MLCRVGCHQVVSRNLSGNLCSVLLSTFSSLSAQITGPRDSLDVMYLLYNITKAAVLHGTRLEAAEAYLTSRNITVVANCPGWCRVRSRLPGYHWSVS